MTVKHVTGDIFALDVDAIGHGVNCKGVMGAGIAVGFKHRFAHMYAAYLNMCQDRRLALGQVFTWVTPSGKVIYNIASQDEPGPNADLEALIVAVRFVRFDAERRGLDTVALPQIGCGIGGLEWHDVRHALIEILSPSPVEFQLVTYYPPPPPPTGLDTFFKNS